MGHDAANRLDQLPDTGGVLRILIDRHDDQATELVLFPVVQHGRREPSFESSHHHRADLLTQGHPGGTEDRVLVDRRGCACRCGRTDRPVRCGRWRIDCDPLSTADEGDRRQTNHTTHGRRQCSVTRRRINYIPADHRSERRLRPLSGAPFHRSEGPPPAVLEEHRAKTGEHDHPDRHAPGWRAGALAR